MSIDSKVFRMLQKLRDAMKEHPRAAAIDHAVIECQ
jgi:hypothetical protein